MSRSYSTMRWSTHRTAFATHVPLNIRHYSASHVFPRRNLLCSVLAEPRKAVLFSSGKKILLHAPKQEKESLHVPRYILCPECASAYAGNAIKGATSVRCPKCSNSFHVTPEDLLVSVAKVEAQSAPIVLSKDRITCQHISSCSGCSVTGLAREPPILNEMRSFLDRFGLRRFPVYMGDVHHWRTHAKMAVRASRGSPITLGLFRSHSHDIEPIPNCTVHAPEINAVAEIVQAALRESTVHAYNEITGKGECRYALFTVQRATRKVQLTIVWNASSWKDSNPKSMPLAAEIWRRSRGLLHSLWFNWNPSSGNVIVRPEVGFFYHALGEKKLIETVLGVKVAFAPYAFRQANLSAFENLLLPKLLSYVPIGSRVAEFCAGVGVIGLTALKHRELRSLVASDISDGGFSPFLSAYYALQKEGIKGKAQYLVGSDSDTIGMVEQNIDVVIVDPPRRGLSEDTVEFLAHPAVSMSLNRIIYVSCGFRAFQEDAKKLLLGDWQLSAGHAFVLFPGSDQIELLAVFNRNRTLKRRRGRGQTRR